MPIPWNEIDLENGRVENVLVNDNPPDYETYGLNLPGNVVTYYHPVTRKEVSTFKPYKIVRSLKQTYINIGVSENGNTCLYTPAVFIGDVDVDDDAWIHKYTEIKEKFPDLKFRIYRTYKGYRFFVVNKLVPLIRFYLDDVNMRTDFETIHKLFTEFGCDTNYVNQVWFTKHFAARLSIKRPSIRDSKELGVASLLESDIPVSKMPWEIGKTIQIHDSFCCN